MLRQCARPACGAPATATLSYDYADRVVWLDPLHAEAHPARHDLCDRHALRLSVPNGWRLENRVRAGGGTPDAPSPGGTLVETP